METFFIVVLFIDFLLFKSYYVVWKLSKLCCERKITQSLNRTMQYGNPITCSSYFICGYSLNRTMQYGNCFQTPKLSSVHMSLNRTMQYGNQRAKLERNCLTNQFKSYYVVWKLLFLSYYIHYFFRLNRTMQYGNL